MSAHAPCVVLVRPQMGENIGAAARAMINCGLEELRLVAPRDGWPNPAARAMASGADAILERAKVYPDLAVAVADRQQVFVTSARLRDQVKPQLDPEAMAEALRPGAALVFGPEATGLSNDEVSHATHLVHVPLNPAHASLNLAQAVLLLGYVWWRAQGSAGAPVGFDMSPEASEEVASAGDKARFIESLLEQLETETRFFEVEEKQARMRRNVRNIFARQDLTAKELRTLYGITRALSRGGGPRDLS